MAWQKIGSLGLSEDLVLLMTSGCHSDDAGRPSAAGHRWMPSVDDRMGDELDARLRNVTVIDEFGELQPIGRIEWAFSPRCRNCVREAKRWFCQDRGLSREQWDRMMGRVDGPVAKAKAGESAWQSERYGWRADGAYGLLKAHHLGSAVAENASAVRTIERSASGSAAWCEHEQTMHGTCVRCGSTTSGR